MMRPLKLFTLLLTMLLFVTGCTASYWRSLLNTSEVHGVVTTKGKVAWKVEFNDEGNSEYLATKTPPVIRVSLAEGSSPVDLQNAEVSYFSPQGGDTGGLGQIEELYAAMPFVVRIDPGAPQEITLGQIITKQLLDLTNPSQSSRLQDVDIEAVVKFMGRNQLGSPVSWQISVPISIEFD